MGIPCKFFFIVCKEKMYIERTTGILFMCLCIIIVVVSIFIVSTKKHSDEIQNLKDLVSSGIIEKQQPFPGGIYSNWDVIDQTIRKPRYHNQNSQGTGNPMITSVKTSLPLGLWTRIGTAYTTNPSDSTVVHLYQKALDPNRDFYQYKIINENGFEIPLDSNITELKNGMSFTIPGWDSKGPFTANITNNGYSYVII